MELTLERVNRLFLDLIAHSAIKSEAIEVLRPTVIETLEWRYELRGAIAAYTQMSQCPQWLCDEACSLLFPGENRAQRQGRDHAFSVDVLAMTPQGQVRQFEFNVAAMNPTDAYAALSKRMTYRFISGIERVDIFDNSLNERKEGQTARRTFNRDELIHTETCASGSDRDAA